MTVAAYYRHARSLGPFRAIDCLALAGQAAALDRAASDAKRVPFIEVDRENGIRMSRSVRVF